MNASRRWCVPCRMGQAYRTCPTISGLGLQYVHTLQHGILRKGAEHPSIVGRGSYCSPCVQYSSPCVPLRLCALSIDYRAWETPYAHVDAFSQSTFIILGLAPLLKFCPLSRCLQVINQPGLRIGPTTLPPYLMPPQPSTQG